MSGKRVIERPKKIEESADPDLILINRQTPYVKVQFLDDGKTETYDSAFLNDEILNAETDEKLNFDELKIGQTVAALWKNTHHYLAEVLEINRLGKDEKHKSKKKGNRILQAAHNTFSSSESDEEEEENKQKKKDAKELQKPKTVKKTKEKDERRQKKKNRGKENDINVDSDDSDCQVVIKKKKKEIQAEKKKRKEAITSAAQMAAASLFQRKTVACNPACLQLRHHLAWKMPVQRKDDINQKLDRKLIWHTLLNLKRMGKFQMATACLLQVVV
ncbi:uncharacterized protein LOC134245206 isoform X2 [Saccostrea cucullata]|uniref:uncharacterized protein LOC134245206 isoform X2 n=1 Tax=Saccostrea cuccullata TaxID=36930 RepID=UPI002ED605F9